MMFMRRRTAYRAWGPRGIEMSVPSRFANLASSPPGSTAPGVDVHPHPPSRPLRKRMVPHAGQRSAAKVSAAGLKRKAPTAKGKGVASEDPARLHAKATEGRKLKPAKHGQGGAAVKDGPGKAKGGKPAQDGKAEEKGKGKGKRKSDIDDIFAGVKRLKEQKAEEEAERVAKKKKIKEEHKRRQANPFTGEGGPEKRWAWADDVKPVRFDDEGLPIYTWDSLRIGQGGGTALCPFDCDCCF